ncbi:GroES-like protein [Mytilinidion resinicola]|uniref:GroES-like protein n=1 Tax=Mytilinidion resinicola TaxID=574789 RepID=A0A6A6YXY8_9PEZI|nr:GroES-like protein [Mytilinidion resinicola]KAF2813640.1 GroES-like protein [Mytilinidion resinicola]
MHAAQVPAWGSPPVYVSIPEPPSTPDTVQIKVLAAGLHRLVRSRAAGTHYSSKTLPHTPGTDGIGTLLTTGQRVYFSTFATGGSFADIVSVPAHAVTPVPDAVDTVQAAAMVNPALSSWMALRARMGGEALPAGFTVLIMGATSASGGIAIEVARALGAGRVIGVARNAAKLATLGLDEAIALRDPVTETDFGTLGDVDVVLDYIYGAPALHLFKSLKSARPVQYVHIGSLDALEVSLPGSVLRSKNLTIRGSGPGAWSFKEMGKELPELLKAMPAMEEQPVKVVPLSEVEKTWGEIGGVRGESGGFRIVFVP